jgi:hypothetical protein
MNSKQEPGDVSDTSLLTEEFNLNKSNSSLDRDEKAPEAIEEPFVVIDYRDYIHEQIRERL